MEFFNQAIDILKILVMALGAGLAVWGVINLLEGYGSDNPAAKSQGIKQLMAGGGVVLIGLPAYPSAVPACSAKCHPVVPFSRKGADVWTLSSTQSLNG